MKKLLSLSALALAAMVASAPASAAIVVSFTPASSHINVGETVAITMSISGLDDEILSAFDINMLFDSAVVRNDWVTHNVATQWGPDSVFGLSVFGVGDTDVFDYTLDDDDTVAAMQANSFAVLTFGFTGLASGVTTIRLGDDLDFAAQLSSVVGLSCLTSTVGTACLVRRHGQLRWRWYNVPEPAGYGLAGLALLGAGFASRRRKPTLAGSPALKIQVMCEGIRYTEALGRATHAHAMPNYYPYRFKEGEPDPTGRGTATIPYLINTPDGTEIRILGNGDSPWHVEGSLEQGYRLIDDRSGRELPIVFEPLCPWQTQKTADGLPFAQAGVTTHGDMLVINVAPGCEYFLHKHDGVLDALRLLRLRRARRAHRAPGAEDRAARDPAAHARAHARGARRGDRADRDPPHLPRRWLADRLAPRGRAFPAAGALRPAGQPPRHPGGAGLGRAARRPDRAVPPRAAGRPCLLQPRDVVRAAVRRSARARRAYVGYARWIARWRRRCATGAAATCTRRWSPASSSSPTSASSGRTPRASRSRAPRTCAAAASSRSTRWSGPPAAPAARLPRPHPQLLRDPVHRLPGHPPPPRAAVSDGFMCHRCAYMQLECDLDRVAQARAA
jgi:hypothetical protein